MGFCAIFGNSITKFGNFCCSLRSPVSPSLTIIYNFPNYQRWNLTFRYLSREVLLYEQTLLHVSMQCKTLDMKRKISTAVSIVIFYGKFMITMSCTSVDMNAAVSHLELLDVWPIICGQLTLPSSSLLTKPETRSAPCVSCFLM